MTALPFVTKQRTALHKKNFYDEHGPEYRLRAVQDIFYNRAGANNYSLAENAGRISLAEGGCLMRPHTSVVAAIMTGIHDYDQNPVQIYPLENINWNFVAEITRFFAEECQIPSHVAENVCMGLGCSHLFDMFLGAVCCEGDIILSPESYYHSFAKWPLKWGGELISVGTEQKSGYKLLARNLQHWIDQNPDLVAHVKAVMICNPTTTGVIYTQQELEDLAQVIQQNGWLVFSDEIFRGSEFVKGSVISFATIPGMDQFVVTAHSGSKTRGVSNMRVGWSCGPADINQKMIEVFEQSLAEMPLYLQRIGLEILRTPQTYLDIATDEYKRRVELLYVEIEAANRRLNHFFNTQDVAYIDLPIKSVSGHYLLVSLEAFRGWFTPDGVQINTSADFARYMTEYSENNILKGVLYSSGFSKGHDDLVVYIAFAQLGYQEMGKAMAMYEKQKISALYAEQNGFVIQHSNEIEEPDYTVIAQSGHAILREALARTERALMRVTPDKG